MSTFQSNVVILNLPFEAKLNLIKQKQHLNILITDSNPVIRTLIAKLGYGLTDLMHDSDFFVRQAVIEKLSENLETKFEYNQSFISIGGSGRGAGMISSPQMNYSQPAWASNNEFTSSYNPNHNENVHINNLINEIEMLKKDNDEVKIILAHHYGILERYSQSPDKIYRIIAAEFGYGLAKLVNDLEPEVRIAVAKQGYDLDRLAHDEDEEVKKIAKKLKPSIRK